MTRGSPSSAINEEVEAGVTHAMGRPGKVPPVSPMRRLSLRLAAGPRQYPATGPVGRSGDGAPAVRSI